jgi:radical SAM superfamily enzyme YgiQ (UPF0313 family)
LSVAILASLVPADANVSFYDDRQETIPYDKPVDLVGITVETFTAKRSYQIAAEFRKRGVQVVLGGFHPTLLPEEAKEFCDAVVIGAAEDQWKNVLKDARNNKLENYYSSNSCSMDCIKPDRRIFKGKKYLPIELVEFGRGCRYSCDFCAVTAFYNNRYRCRSIKDVIKEIEHLGNRNIIFFVDDNIVANPGASEQLLHELCSLNIKWIGQASIDIAFDNTFIDLLVRSGCIGLAIGFESLEKKNLLQMRKYHNLAIQNYDTIIKSLRDSGIIVYGTFVFGYDYDTVEIFKRTLDFSLKNKLYIANFNHLIPYPGTPLYKRLKVQKRLLYDKWWLDNTYRYGDVAFKPRLLTPEELSHLCMQTRVEFNKWSSIFRRVEFAANCKDIRNTFNYFLYNTISKREITKKQYMYLG